MATPYIHDHYTFVKEANLSDVKSHVCFRLPRNMLIQCAMTLSQFRRQSSAKARNYEIALHLFFQMAHVAYEMGKNGDCKEMIKVSPFMKMYMEWVPKVDEPDVAVEYRFHLFVFDEAIKLGDALKKIIEDANKIHKTHITRTSNSRGPDPLTGLKDYQSYLKVHEQMYYNTICSMARGDHKVSNALDDVIDPGVSINDPANLANPINVWSLKNCIRNSVKEFPTKAQELFQLTKQYEAGPETYTFPSHDHIIRLSPFLFQPSEIVKKFLPEYQRHLESEEPVPTPIAPPSGVEDEDDEDDDMLEMEPVSALKKLLPDVPAEYDNGFRPGTYGQYESRNASDMEKERQDQFAPSSDIAIMERRAKMLYKKKLAPLEGTEEFAAARRIHQEYLVKEMQSRCLNADAEISLPGKAIIAWINNLSKIQDEMPLAINCVIEDLSVFATSVCRSYLFFENLFMVSTQHMSLYMTLMGSLDAYRHSHTLHWNGLQAGAFATSKSFTLDEMVSCRIPGTVDQLTRQTMMAEAVDGDRDDQIVVYDEFPPGMGVSSTNKKNMDNSQATMFKTRLTSNMVITKTFWLDEATGRRSCRLSKSSCIGCTFVATNDPVDQLDPALASRFFISNFEKQRRKGRDIDDCVNGLRNMSDNDKLNMRRAKNYFRIQQARVFLVENMIRVGILKEPTMTVVNILLQQFKEGIQRRGIQVSNARTWTRVKIMCRIQTICTALDIVFNCTDSPYVNSAFEYKQLLDIEPYLVCTEEILCFTLTMLSNEFYSPVEHKILSQLYKMKRKTQNKFGNSERDISNDYIKLPNMSRLSKMLQGSLSLDAGKTSLHNISSVLNGLSLKSFQTKSYRPLGAEECGFPDVNENTMETSQQCAHITYDGVYIHVGQLLSHENKGEFDPVVEVIQELGFASSDTKMMLTSRPVDRNKPYLLQLLKRVPTEKQLSHNNVLFNSNMHREFMGTNQMVSATRKRRKISYSEDVDVVALKEHAEKIASVPATLPIGGLGDVSITYAEFCSAQT